MSIEFNRKVDVFDLRVQKICKELRESNQDIEIKEEDDNGDYMFKTDYINGNAIKTITFYKKI